MENEFSTFNSSQIGAAHNRVDGLTGFFIDEVRLSRLSAEALRTHDHVAYAYAEASA